MDRYVTQEASEHRMEDMERERETESINLEDAMSSADGNMGSSMCGLNAYCQLL